MESKVPSKTEETKINTYNYLQRLAMVNEELHVQVDRRRHQATITIKAYIIHTKYDF